MAKEIGPRELQLREQREQRFAQREVPKSSGGGDVRVGPKVGNSGKRHAAAGVTPSPPEAKRGLRIKNRSSSTPNGEGIALTSMVIPDEVLEKTAAAIADGRLSLRRGRGRPKASGKRPWEEAGLTRSAWYRRQKEKAK